MKKELDQLGYIKGAINELMLGLSGEKPFSWGDAERKSKTAWLSRLGFVLVSKSKLERGGHELKRGMKPVGCAYYKAPLSRHADLYLLGIQTTRTYKWHSLWKKGKALCEDGEYGLKNEDGSYGVRSREEKIKYARERLAALQSYIADQEELLKNE